MILSEVWHKEAQVIFSKTKKIARVRGASAACGL